MKNVLTHRQPSSADGKLAVARRQPFHPRGQTPIAYGQRAGSHGQRTVAHAENHFAHGQHTVFAKEALKTWDYVVAGSSRKRLVHPPDGGCVPRSGTSRSGHSSSNGFRTGRTLRLVSDTAAVHLIRVSQ